MLGGPGCVEQHVQGQDTQLSETFPLVCGADRATYVLANFGNGPFYSVTVTLADGKTFGISGPDHDDGMWKLFVTKDKPMHLPGGIGVKEGTATILGEQWVCNPADAEPKMNVIEEANCTRKSDLDRSLGR